MGILRDTYIVNNNTDTSRISYEMSRKNDIEESQKQKELIDKISKIINYYGTDKEHNDNSTLRYILKNMLDILNEVK